MPIDYKKYAPNWKTEIRPAILERAKDKCEFCNIPNGLVIERGFYNEIEAYQDCLKDEGAIYKAENSEYITHDYLGSLEKPSGRMATVVLTIAHLDHDTKNNDYANLKALCQRCHNRYDAPYRKANRKKNKGQKELF
jgi:5-methylcytosine-specific restriction endonuclease McrA